MLSSIEHWLQFLATLTGLAVIFIPIIDFRHAESRLRGRELGAVARLLRWPVMLVQTIFFVVLGIAAWHSLPLVFLSSIHILILIFGSLLYFPGIILYLWGYWSLGRMFGISSGFGASLYQNHCLIQSGPYRYVRHPMYLAVILAAFGALLIFRNWAMVIFAPLSLGVIIRAGLEEQLLAEEFKEEWDSYCQEVNGWIPGLQKRVK